MFSPTWPMASRRKPLALFLAYLVIHFLVCLQTCSPSSCMAHGYTGSTCRFQEEVWNGQQGGTSYNTWMRTKTAQQLPADSSALYFEIEQELWTLAFFLSLLRMAGLFPWWKEEMGFETGVWHSPRSHSTWVKPLPFCISVCFMNLAFVATGNQTYFCLVTKSHVLSPEPLPQIQL